MGKSIRSKSKKYFRTLKRQQVEPLEVLKLHSRRVRLVKALATPEYEQPLEPHPQAHLAPSHATVHVHSHPKSKWSNYSGPAPEITTIPSSAPVFAITAKEINTLKATKIPSPEFPELPANTKYNKSSADGENEEMIADSTASATKVKRQNSAASTKKRRGRDRTPRETVDADDATMQDEMNEDDDEEDAEEATTKQSNDGAEFGNPAYLRRRKRWKIKRQESMKKGLRGVLINWHRLK